MEEPTNDAVKMSRRMKISELRQKLHWAELEEVIEEAGGVLGVLRPVVANSASGQRVTELFVSQHRLTIKRDSTLLLLFSHDYVAQQKLK